MNLPTAVLLDLDGTVYQGREAIPGAASAIYRLRKAGVPVRFVTNTTRLPRRRIVQRLHGLGIPANPAEIFTALIAVTGYLNNQGIRVANFCVSRAALEDLGELVQSDSDNAAAVEAVVIGDMGDEWTFRRLDLAFRQLMEGAQLIAIQRNRFWKTERGLSLDAGPFIAALEYAAGKEAVTVGKPSAPFFIEAAASMGVDIGQVVMVGDDIATDVFGAKAAGAGGILVQTGKFRSEDIERGELPDRVIGSIAELPELLGIR